MRSPSVLLATSVLTLTACGSSGSGGKSSPADVAAFDPPPPADGYTRLKAVTVPDIEPGADVTYCQYAMAPFDHDVDIIDVTGHQSKFGHHAIAFSYAPSSTDEIGSNFPCMGTEFSSGGSAPEGGASNGNLSMGAFLGGVAGAGGTKSAPLPEGVVFRMKQGSGIMLNVHYLNTGDSTIDGDAVVDFKFADVDTGRKVAAMYLNLNMGFNLPAAKASSSSVECVAGSDVAIIMMANHMHEYGSSATTEVVRGDTGAVETLHTDETWSYEMQFNLQYSRWQLDSPFMIHKGDTVRTTCNWMNSTSDAMAFPREMCVGVGFTVMTGADTRAPACANGTWIDQFI